MYILVFMKNSQNLMTLILLCYCTVIDIFMGMLRLSINQYKKSINQTHAHLQAGLAEFFLPVKSASLAARSLIIFSVSGSVTEGEERGRVKPAGTEVSAPFSGRGRQKQRRLSALSLTPAQCEGSEGRKTVAVKVIWRS